MSLIWPTVHLVNALFTQCIVTGSNERGCRWFCKHGRILALFPPPPRPFMDLDFLSSSSTSKKGT